MGIPELIDDGESGLLVAPGRADELTDALERLLAEPGLRHSLGAEGREKVLREFDVERCAAELHRLFAAELGWPAQRATAGEVAKVGA